MPSRRRGEPRQREPLLLVVELVNSLVERVSLPGSMITSFAPASKCGVSQSLDAVGVGAVAHSGDDVGVAVVINGEQDAVIAASGAVEAFEVVAQRLVRRCGLLARSPELNSMTA